VALIYVSPLFEKRMTFITEKYKIRELLVATIATQIFVLPFIFYQMGLISLISLPANILILPFIPLIMLFGFLTGIIGLFSVTLAIPVAFISSLFLSYVLKVIYFFSHLPFSSIFLEYFPLVFVIIIYGIFLIVIWRFTEFLKSNDE
jgi:competence protein ComEC